MAKGPHTREIQVTVTTSVITNPGQNAFVPGASITVTQNGSPAARTAVVYGQVPNTSVIIRNPDIGS